MVADDVKVAVVDEGLVAQVEDELDVVHLRLHEDVDHREVDVARVGEGHLANVKSFPDIRKLLRIIFYETTLYKILKGKAAFGGGVYIFIPGRRQVAEIFIVILGRIKVADGNVVVVATAED